MDTSGSPPRELLPGRLLYSPELTWSPDGSRIAFYAGDVWTVDVSSGATRRWTNNAPGAHGPAWSPDGRWLVYMVSLHASSDPESTAGLQLIDTETGQQRALFHDGAHATYGWTPTWMPDGEHVLYSSRDQPDAGELVIADVHRGPLRHVTHLGKWCMDPQVSSDGNSIYFHLAPNSDASVDPYYWDSWVIHSDGAEAHRIPAALGDHRVQFGWEFELSHSGDAVAYAGLDSRGRGGVIRSINLDGSNPRQLTAP